MQKSLFGELCQNRLLFAAWKHVKQKGSSGGIDGFSIANFEENIDVNLSQLKEDLCNHNWQPEPYLQFSIPKNETEKRQLGLLSVRDKVVQQAIKKLIEPRFEREFVSNSYGYRPGKGHNKAIRFIKSCCRNNKFQYVLRLDIDNYFDTIDHDLLFKRIYHLIGDEEILRLVRLCVKMGMVNRKLKWDEIKKGVPQGAVLSPLLANYYLHSFDQFVLSRTKMYVRYADDFIIGTSNRSEAEKLLKECSSFLNERLKLQLNEPIITEIEKGIEFLGITIDKKTLSLSQKKQNELKNKILSLEWNQTGFNEKNVKSLYGINNYYAKLLPQEYLIEFDKILIEQLKKIIENNWKDISSKSVLLSNLNTLPFFAEQNILQRNKLQTEIINTYLYLKSSEIEKKNDIANKKIILARKKEYRKKENEASEIVINTFGTFIGVGKKGISLKIMGKKRQLPSSVNLHHITILSDGVSISSNALSYCMQKHIGIDLFSNTGKHVGSFISTNYMHTSLWEKQRFLSVKERSNLAVNIIRGKIKNQMNLVKYFHKYHKDNSKELRLIYEKYLPRIKSILKAITDLINDKEYVGKLVNLEAQSAELYWQYIAELIKDDNVDFTHRERKGATDIVNSLLNYGYSILYARIWQFVLVKRLNPTDSVIHVSQSGKPTLVYDIIELFRTQAVDRVVIALIQKKESVNINNGLLDNNTKKLLVKNVIERLNRYEQYRGKECRLCDIMKYQIGEIAEYVETGNKYKPYISKW